MLLSVFLLSDLPILGLEFIHLVFMSCILECSCKIYYLVIIFRFYWMVDEEKSFRDLMVVWVSLVLAGLILICLGLEGKLLVLPSDMR